MGEYTYLLGLLIMGTVVFTVAMAGIERSRRARPANSSTSNRTAHAR